MPNLIGKLIGRYQIIKEIGRGGMAVVYQAKDTHLDNDVAVKVISTDQLPPAALERTLKRFEHEAKEVARLNHPNIVKVTDYGEQDGTPYLVMPYIPGGTLKQYLQDHGRMSWKDAAKLLIPITDALGYAHKMRLIHRDVKPTNILLTADNIPMLTDFGVAKVLDEETTLDLTGTNATVGTPEYMAPEQVMSKTVDHRADIYALGVVFYEMVTGQRPFTGETPMSVLFKHASEPLPSPRRFVPDLPADVESFLQRAMAKRPEDRYATMEEMGQALFSLTKGIPLQSNLQVTSSNLSTFDDLGTMDDVLGTVDQVLDQNQNPPSLSIDHIQGPIQIPYYSPAPPAQKTGKSGTIWIVFGVILVIGVSAFLLVRMLRQSPSSQGINPSYQNESSSSYTEEPYVQQPPSEPIQESEIPISIQPTEPPVITLSPTFTPTPFTCPGMLPSRVKVDDKAKVCTKEDRLIIRQDPFLSAVEIRRIPTGTEFTIIEGPECNDDSTWWKIKLEVNSVWVSGWVREGTDEKDPYFICPVPKN